MSLNDKALDKAIATMNQVKISDKKLTLLIEAAIFSSDHPVSVQQLKDKVLAGYQVSKKRILHQLVELSSLYDQRGIELVEVASGFRFQVKSTLATELLPISQEKPQKYSQALLETVALIAYKQPITRGEIEDIRGVSVSSHIIKTLVERHWVKTVGHKEVPGRPLMYATTKAFLDYFSLKSLKQLPELMPISESTITSSDIHDIIGKENPTQ